MTKQFNPIPYSNPNISTHHILALLPVGPTPFRIPFLSSSPVPSTFPHTTRFTRHTNPRIHLHIHYDYKNACELLVATNLLPTLSRSYLLAMTLTRLLGRGVLLGPGPSSTPVRTLSPRTPSLTFLTTCTALFGSTCRHWMTCLPRYSRAFGASTASGGVALHEADAGGSVEQSEGRGWWWQRQSTERRRRSGGQEGGEARERQGRSRKRSKRTRDMMREGGVWERNADRQMGEMQTRRASGYM